MQEIFYTVLGFVVYVIAQSFVINGIKIASSGETEIKPDGTERDSPMILYPLAKFINQHWTEKCRYTNDSLAKLIKEMKQDYPGIVPDFKMPKGSEFWIVVQPKEAMAIMIGVAKKMKAAKGIQYQVLEDMISFYKEYKVFRFSKWLRMPTFGCIRCMSSLWSIGTYWYPMILLFGFYWWMIPLWFANIAAVTFVNTYLAQRYTE